MASAQQKPKRDRGTRNSARSNGKAFKTPTTKGKPSYNSCLGVSVKRLIAKAKGEAFLYSEIVALYMRKASQRNWTTPQACAKAEAWMTGYYSKCARRAQEKLQEKLEASA